MVSDYELSVRKKPKGGGVRDAVVELRGTARRRSRVVLLLHGYANSQPGARESYLAFLDNFVRAWPQRKDLFGDFFKFYWPGDEPWPVINQLSYPFQIRNARRAGEVLARYLATLDGPGGATVSVYLVAHSLGNRVALEMLRAFRAAGNAKVRMYLCTMAAAVPVYKVRPLEDLHDADIFRRTFTLHSRKDRVLKWAFPAGQTAALEGFFPQAVGRFGEPRSNWARTEDLQPYGHSDYWPGPQTAPVVGEFLRLPAARRLPSAAAETNDLPEPNRLGASAGPAARRPPSRPSFG